MHSDNKQAHSEVPQMLWTEEMGLVLLALHGYNTCGIFSFLQGYTRNDTCVGAFASERNARKMYPDKKCAFCVCTGKCFVSQICSVIPEYLPRNDSTYTSQEHAVQGSKHV